MKLVIVNPNLRTPDRITVRIKNEVKFFDSKKEVDNDIIDYINKEFAKHHNPFLNQKAKIYYDIDWDCDDVYYGYIEE